MEVFADGKKEKLEEREDLLEGKKASSLDLSQWEKERSQVSLRQWSGATLMSVPWWVKSGAAFALSHPLESAVSIALLANPTTRVWAARIGWEVGKITVSAGVSTARAITIVTYEELILGSRLAAGSKLAARMTGAVAAGYVIGSVVGTGIAYKFWGKKGAQDALRFYTNPFGVDYWSTVSGAVKTQVWD